MLTKSVRIHTENCTQIQQKFLSIFDWHQTSTTFGKDSTGILENCQQSSARIYSKKLPTQKVACILTSYTDPSLPTHTYIKLHAYCEQIALAAPQGRRHDKLKNHNNFKSISKDFTIKYYYGVGPLKGPPALPPVNG